MTAVDGRAGYMLLANDDPKIAILPTRTVLQPAPSLVPLTCTVPCTFIAPETVELHNADRHCIVPHPVSSDAAVTS